MYDLIIKPTELCNFKCSFCSSNQIADKHNQILNIELIKKFLLNHDTGTIIVNGGDPLMVSPSYYFELLDFMQKHNIKAELSFTTNLWDFWLHPAKWVSLFRHPQVAIGTSFQYGDGRYKGDGSAFTDNDFIKIFYLFKELVGYKLSFIGVITEKTEPYILKTVQLAKTLGTICKLNPAVQSGKALHYYPLYKAYEQYYKIYQTGLAKYEFNTLEIAKMLRKEHTICPYLIDCYKTIRALAPNGTYHTCGSFNDDSKINLTLYNKTYNLEQYPENEIQKDFFTLKNECLGCDYFMLCNHCKKRIRDIKCANKVEEHCKHMQRIAPLLLEMSQHI